MTGEEDDTVRRRRRRFRRFYRVSCQCPPQCRVRCDREKNSAVVLRARRARVRRRRRRAVFSRRPSVTPWRRRDLRSRAVHDMVVARNA